MGNLNLQKLVLFAIILGAAPAFSQNMCSSLFQHPVASKKSPLNSYEKALSEYKGKNSSFTVEGKILETLTWMLKELDGVEAPSTTVAKELVKLKSDISRATLLKRISYEDFVVLAHRFSAGTSYKFFDQIKEKEEVFKILSGERASDIKAYLEESQFFFLPTTLTLGMESMNRFHAEGIAVLGLTSKIEVVDGREYLPYDFFRHDVDHASNYERQPFTGVGKTYPELSFNEKKEFYYKFENYVEGKVTDSRTKKIYHTLWFLVFHETGLPVHPQNLKDQLQLLRGNSNEESRINTLLLRLNDPQDLGYSFKDRKLNEEEVNQAVDDLIQFTNQ